MQEKLVFEYAVIRVVPRVEREEFVNVGLILFCKRKKYLAMRFTVDHARLKALFPELDVLEIEAYLKAWDVICKGEKQGGEISLKEPAERFRWLTAAKSTILQCSKVHPGRSASPENLLEDLFGKYVG